MYRLAKGTVIAAILGAAIEVTLRTIGVVDFPLYQDSVVLGYVPAPSQHGSFLYRYDWAFNDLSMGVPTNFVASSTANTALIGDSIVYGGLHLKQSEKLGPLLSKLVCGAVWPASAESWAFLNELRYLHSNKQILPSLSRIIFVLNSGDFGAASKWSSELTHPTHRPFFATAYVLKRILSTAPDQFPSADNNWRDEFSWLLREYSGPITLVLYPDKEEVLTQSGMAKQSELLKPFIGKRVSLVKVADSREWNDALYRDAIHPNAIGNEVLAAILSGAVHECAT